MPDSIDRVSPGLMPYAIRVVCICQAVIAFPIMVILGASAFSDLWYTYNINIYDFITWSSCAIMAAGINFLIAIQLKIPLSPHLRLRFETVKSVLATLLWLWLILDAAFGPWRHYSYSPDPDHVQRTKRTIRAALVVVVLFLVFYPTLIVAFYARKREEKADDGQGENDTERTPLLSNDV